MASKRLPGARRDGRGRFMTVQRESGRIGRLRQARKVRTGTVLKMLERVKLT